MTTFKIISICLLVISLIIMLFFLLMLFINFINIKQTRNLIDFYNRIVSIDFEAKTELLSSLANYDNKYEDIIHLIFNFKAALMQHIKSFNNEVVVLKFYNKNISILKERKIINNLTKDMHQIINEIKKHNKIIDIMYYNYYAISNLILEYVSIINDVIGFYEKNLMNKIDNGKIRKLIKKINNNLYVLVADKKNYDINNISYNLEQVNDLLQDFIKLLSDSYIQYKLLIVLKNNIKEIDNIMITSNITSHDSIYVEKVKSKILGIIKLIDNNLSNSNLTNNYQLLIDAFKYFEAINEKLKYNLKFNNIVVESNKNIYRWLENIFNNSLVINENILKIKQKHSNDKNVINLANKILFNTRNLIEHFDNFKKERNKFDYEAKNYIDNIQKTLHKIYDWKFDIRSLKKYLEYESKAYLRIIKDVYSFKLTLSNIFYLVNYYQITEISKEKILLAISDLDAIENKVFSNDKNQKNNIDEALINIKYYIAEISFLVMDWMKIENYAKSLLMYANRYYYVNEEIKAIINKANKLFKEKKFSKSVDILSTYLVKNEKKIKLAI